MSIYCLIAYIEQVGVNATWEGLKAWKEENWRAKLEDIIMNIEIAITNLGTHYFYYRNITCKEDYDNAVKEFCDNYPNDFEIQLIESDIRYVDSDNLYDFLEIVDETEESEEVIAFLLNWYSKEDVKKIFEDYNFYVVEATSATEAIAEYLRNVICIEIPEHLEYYIDWEQFQIDYECNGYFIKELNLEEYIIVVPF